MKTVFFLLILSVSFFSFKTNEKGRVKNVLHEARIVDSIISSYRSEFKNHVLSVYNDAYYLAQKEHYKAEFEDMKQMLGEAYNFEIRNRDSLELQKRSGELDKWRKEYEKSLDSIKRWNGQTDTFESTDSLLTMTWVKNSDCIDYCIYRYRNDIIKVTTFNYDAFFELYYSNKELIMFIDSKERNSCALPSNYSATFYFDHSQIIGQEITGKPHANRFGANGNRCSQNAFTQKDSILKFSDYIQQGIVINSCYHNSIKKE